MTTQKQLEKIILNYLNGNTKDIINPITLMVNYVLSPSERKELASAILSAMKIGEEKLRELWGELYTQEPFKNTVLDAGLGIAYIKLIASHAQEIIKFEEE